MSHYHVCTCLSWGKRKNYTWIFKYLDIQLSIFGSRYYSKAMVLSWKRLDCPLRIGNESLPQVQDIKDLWVGPWMLHWCVAVRKALSLQAKRSIYAPIVSYEHLLESSVCSELSGFRCAHRTKRLSLHQESERVTSACAATLRNPSLKHIYVYWGVKSRH